MTRVNACVAVKKIASVRSERTEELEPVPPAHFLLHGSAKKSSFVCLLGIGNAMHCGYVYTKDTGHIHTVTFFFLNVCSVIWGHPADFPHATYYMYTLHVHKAGSLELSLSIVAVFELNY